MKKLICLGFVMLLVTLSTFNNGFGMYIFSLSTDLGVCFYLGEAPASYIGECVKNGEGYILKTTADFAKENFSNLSGCYGFSVEIDKNKTTTKNLLDKITITKTEKIDNLQIFYGVASGLPFSTIIENKKVNIQIAISESKIILGSPIILGSY